jgi:hypothetical protein
MTPTLKKPYRDSRRNRKRKTHPKNAVYCKRWRMKQP